MFSPSFDINPCPSSFLDQDHLQSNMGTISGTGSFVVQFGNHLRSGVILRSWDHLRIRTVPREQFTNERETTASNWSFDLTRNNELAFSSTTNLQFSRFQILKLFFLYFSLFISKEYI